MSARAKQPAAKKPCAKCRRRPRRPGQRWCDACHADYQRRYRARKKREQETLGQAFMRLSPEQRARFLDGSWQLDPVEV